MVKLKPGDCVMCRLKDGTIVNAYSVEFDDVKSFNIIAVDKTGYYLFVPSYLYIKASVRADRYLLKKLELDHKYLNDTLVYIGEGFVYKVKSVVDGSTCSRCKDFIHLAEHNQSDGSFICWSCRNNKYR